MVARRSSGLRSAIVPARRRARLDARAAIVIAALLTIVALGLILAYSASAR